MPVLPEYELTGQVALLATSGGDEAPYFASALAEAGATVFPVARTQKLLDALLNALPSGSFGAVMNPGSDVSAARVLDELDRSHGRGGHSGQRLSQYVRRSPNRRAAA